MPLNCLCDQHLLGFHKELHTLAGCLLKGKSIKGFIKNKQLFPQDLYTCHHNVSVELEARGFKHFSRVPSIDNLPFVQHDVLCFKRDVLDLACRCEDCKGRLEKEGLL